MALQRDRIQNALLDQVANCTTFHPVTIDPTTKRAVTNEAASVQPQTVEADQLGARFDDARRNRQRLLRERVGWSFSLIVKWGQKVSLEKFEKQLCESPVVLPRVAGLDQQVVLLLTDADYREPVQQSGSSGTWVAYTFDALLSPI
jgi:hypothetical protein